MEKPKSLSDLQTTMNRIITVKKYQILEKKPIDAQYLNYGDFTDICDAVKEGWCKLMGESEVPKPIEGVCYLSLAIISPDIVQKAKLLSQAQAALAGIAGITAIISAVGLALGWGTGVIGTVTAFFCGTPVAGPIGLLAGGLLLAAIAAYFVIKSGNEKEMADKAEKSLRDGLRNALEGLWELRSIE